MYNRKSKYFKNREKEKKLPHPPMPVPHRLT
jgi:hypothetical protein